MEQRKRTAWEVKGAVWRTAGTTPGITVLLRRAARAPVLLRWLRRASRPLLVVGAGLPPHMPMMDAGRMRFLAGRILAVALDVLDDCLADDDGWIAPDRIVIQLFDFLD